jgi:hypothetical protein
MQEDRQKRPWKYSEKQPGWFPEDVLQAKIVEALTCFQQDDLYDPALRNLVEYRLALVESTEIAHAISLDQLAKPSHGLFFSDDPHQAASTRDQKKHVDETEAFWQAVIQHTPLQERLVQLNQVWQGSICLGAHCLRTFFLLYSSMRLRHRETPFFVAELLAISLEHVDWHAIVTRILGTAVSSCQCSSKPSRNDESAVNVLVFQELLKLTSDEIRCASRMLPDHLRSNALFLSGLCKDMAQVCTAGPE